MWAHLLTVEDYQGLINRGWRRSGTFMMFVVSLVNILRPWITLFYFSV